MKSFSRIVSIYWMKLRLVDRFDSQTYAAEIGIVIAILAI